MTINLNETKPKRTNVAIYFNFSGAFRMELNYGQLQHYYKISKSLHYQLIAFYSSVNLRGKNPKIPNNNTLRNLKCDFIIRKSYDFY